MATRLAAPSRSPAVVTAVLATGPDFRAVLGQAERAAERLGAGKGKRRYVEAYLLAILEHRVAVEAKVIPQVTGVQ